MAPLKNTGLFLLAAFCMSIFIGCADGNDVSEGKNTDAEKVAAVKEMLAIPAETDSDLDLPLVLNGVAISWASSDEGIISNEGLITRQQYGSKVTLTATLAFGKATAVKEFTVTVIALAAEDEDAAKVAAAIEALAIPEETDCDLDLPVILNGVAISWASSDEGIISNEGLITRQQYGSKVTLTATLAFGKAVDTKEFTVSVIALAAEDEDAAKVAEAKEALVIPAETDSDLDLPLVLKGVAISWASSDEDVISNTGAVTRQLYDVQAVLTATLTLGSAVETKEFTVTVIAVVEEEAELFDLDYWWWTSGVPQNWIEMKHPDENVVFNCSVDNGYFQLYFYNGNIVSYGEAVSTKNINLHSGDIIHWYGYEIGGGNPTENAIIEIVLNLDENIMGYVVIEAYRNYDSIPHYSANILKSVLFPKIDGEYQKISEKYVKAAIEKIKAEAIGD